MPPHTLSPDLLARAAALYALHPADLTPLPGGNFAATFAYAHPSGPAVLRVAPPDPTVTLASTRSMLAFLDHLAAGAVPVPRPLPSAAGRLVEILPGPSGEPYLVTSFQRAPGVRAETLPVAVWTDDLIAALGALVARFHAAAASYPRSAELPAWDEVGNLFNPGPDALAAAGPAVQTARAAALAALAALPRGPADFGPAHLDLHFANLMVEPSTGQITLIDFDDCARGWFLMDLAVLRFDLPVLHGQPFAERFFARFLAAYARARPLDEDGHPWQNRGRPGLPNLDALPHFLKLLETGVYADLCRDWRSGDDPGGWVGRFMTGRLERIKAGVPYTD